MINVYAAAGSQQSISVSEPCFFLLVVFHVYEFGVLNVDKSVISLCVFVSLFPLCSTLINLCCF